MTIRYPSFEEASRQAWSHAERIGGHVRPVSAGGAHRVAWAVYAGPHYADGRDVTNDNGWAGPHIGPCLGEYPFEPSLI